MYMAFTKPETNVCVAASSVWLYVQPTTLTVLSPC